MNNNACQHRENRPMLLQFNIDDALRHLLRIQPAEPVLDKMSMLLTILG
jgi:hypothetical protein